MASSALLAVSPPLSSLTASKSNAAAAANSTALFLPNYPSQAKRRRPISIKAPAARTTASRKSYGGALGGDSGTVGVFGKAGHTHNSSTGGDSDSLASFGKTGHTASSAGGDAGFLYLVFGKA